MRGGFTLVEALIVVALILVLVGIAIPFFLRQYVVFSMKGVILTDLRTCISKLVEKHYTEELTFSQAVGECPKSPYTESIEIISENPLVLRATGRNNLGTISCTYYANSGSIDCESIF